MKRTIVLIAIALLCTFGFVYAGGAFAAPNAEMNPALDVLFGGEYSVIFVIAFIGLLGTVLYRKELSRLVHAFYLKVSGTTTYEDYEDEDLEPSLANRVQFTERRRAATGQALDKFSHAVEKYAMHLSSHTSAIEGLNAASKEIDKSTAEQNRILKELLESADSPPPRPGKPAWKIDNPPLPEPETEEPPRDIRPEPTEPPRNTGPENHLLIKPPTAKGLNHPPGCARKPRPATGTTATLEKPMTVATRLPDGIIIEPESLTNVRQHVQELRAKANQGRTRKSLTARALAAEAEILSAIRNLNAKLDDSEIQE